MRAEVGLYGRSPEELAVATWDRTAELVLFRVDALVLAVVAHPAEELLAVLALEVGFVRRELVGCDAGIDINISIGVARLVVRREGYGG